MLTARTQKQFLVILTMVFLVNGVNVIKMLSLCSCSVNGTIYNLKPLKPVSFREQRVPNIKWSYSPCEPISRGNCKEAAICGVDKTNKTIYRSPQVGMKCKVTTEGSVEFVYPGSLYESPINTPGKILLKCDPKAKEPTLEVLDDDKDEVVLRLTDPCACGNACLDKTPLKPNPHKLSGGAIAGIVIGAIVVFAAIAIAYNYCKPRRGLEGQALLPDNGAVGDRVGHRDDRGDGAENEPKKQAIENSYHHLNS